MIEVRALAATAEFEQALRLQQIIWGFADHELLPVRLFVVASKVGGQVFGAFDRDRLIGFCVATPGIKPGGKPYLHSHMLGVLPEYHNSGVGRRLKLLQREEALGRALDLIEWTFDPLDVKNAYFNLERLGAVVRRYVQNQYGTTSSHLHGSLPTDRCVAEWWLASRRVERALAGEPPERGRIERRIEVPAEIDRLRREHAGGARDVQKRVTGEFLEAFSRGLAAIGFEKTRETGAYLLGTWASE
ncbi:MAG: GNAT family N-acetyltransferase [Acidobacteria bacterium]|nr:GNAT family N-acetyltransferase [Acidobacteriota bacterium]